jgi:hypothetical protein
MKINHPYGSRERLFEMIHRVAPAIITEEILPQEKKEEVISQLVAFACEYLGISTDDAHVELSYDPTEAAQMFSFGKQTPSTGVIRVVVVNRNLADVLRTLAHELVHRKQQLEGKLHIGAGDDGTDIENEANAEAAIIMRKFGKANPIIFE